MRSCCVITGLGAITALGRGVEAQAECLVSGRRRMASPTLFDSAGRGPVAEVGSDDLPALSAGYEPLGSRGCLMALASVDEALESARLDEAQLSKTAVFLGTTSSGILEGEVAFEGVKPGDPRPEYRHFDDQYVAGAIGRAVAKIRGIGGPRATISTACSSSANALTMAAGGIEQGRFERALVIGVDTLTRMTYFGFGSLGLVSPGPCSPFDRDREGLTLGEAGACLVVESAEAARRRGAPVVAQVLGWARNVDGHHITQPDPEGNGIEACIRAALAHSGLEPAQVDHVNAHGTGTPQNDLVEGTVIGRVFGRDSVVTSTKSYTGHTLGAAGALEAIYSTICIEGGFIPPTLGVEHVDERLDLDVVIGASRQQELRHVISNSFGFGGSNCCVVIGRAGGRS